MVLTERPRTWAMARTLYFIWGKTGQLRAKFRLELLVALGWVAMNLRTLLGGGRCN